MNSFLELLNVWGAAFVAFAWPMLWQSSLLIVVLFALDVLLRQRARAVLRYGLWLVVLLKLVLPPSLALPTSIAWWLPTHMDASQSQNVGQRTYVVSYEPGTASFPIAKAAAPLPPTSMTIASWLFIIASAGALAFFGVSVARWIWLSRKLRSMSAAPDFVKSCIIALQGELRVRGRVRLRVTDLQISPMVCGLFTPTIVLPRTLLAKLDSGQLRAVLMHELIHVRRYDVLVNCLQALLQVLYWWHPLVWFANTQIRRAREEAVDDVVAGHNSADSYAQTLVEVARHAFTPLQANLGFLGILESRRGLRQRVLRLMRAPAGSARFGWVSALGLVAFAAIAAPMGQAPTKQSPTPSATANVKVESHPGADTNLFSRRYRVNNEAFVAAISHQTGITNIHDAPAVRAGFSNLLRTTGVDLSPPKAIFYNDQRGELFARATLADLDVMEQLLQTITAPPAQIHLQARLLEMPDTVFKAWLTTILTNGAILDAKQTSAIVETSRNSDGVELLELPAVTSLSGRQTQIKCVEVKAIVTGVSTNETGLNAATPLLTESVELGPALDLTPLVAPDDISISLDVRFSDTAFLGYDPPSAKNMQPSPRFRIRSTSATTHVLDGHTLVMRPASDSHGQAAENRKQLLVMITPTMIDPAGNRIHPELK